MEGKKVSEEWEQCQHMLETRRDVLALVADLDKEEAVIVLASAINECLLPRGLAGTVTYRYLGSFASQG